MATPRETAEPLGIVKLFDPLIPASTKLVNAPALNTPLPLVLKVLSWSAVELPKTSVPLATVVRRRQRVRAAQGQRNGARLNQGTGAGKPAVEGRASYC